MKNPIQKHHIIATAVCAIVVSASIFTGKCEAQIRKKNLMDAICNVESNCDSSKVGDNGDSIGAYQIQYAYWLDATEFSGIGGEYEDVLDDEYAQQIVLAYWNRYATMKRLGRIPTDEDRARIHNGGPNGYKKTATVIYWNNIKKELND